MLALDKGIFGYTVPIIPKAARQGHGKHSFHKVRCAASRIQPKNLTPMLNEDARSHWLGRDNVGYATIEGKRMPVLLDMGANVNMITPECMVALGLQMGPLMDLHEGGITIDQPFNYEGRPIGYVIMNVQIKGISGYNEDQVTLVAHSSAEFAHHIPIILGTPTMDRAIKTLKESEIDKLATPWACVRKSTLLRAATTRVAAVRADVTMKPIDIMGYEEPIHLLAAEVVEPFETLVVKARTKITFTAGHLCCSTLAMDSKDGTLPPQVGSDWCLHGPKEGKQDSTHHSA